MFNVQTDKLHCFFCKYALIVNLILSVFIYLLYNLPAF